VYGHGSVLPASRDPGALALGGAALAVGQVLNWSVFYRLGTVGVFYGDRLGYEVPWCQAFPFSWLSHPQYVGTVLSIWGFFLVMRFPEADWLVLPVLETVYYVVGSLLEEPRAWAGVLAEYFEGRHGCAGASRANRGARGAPSGPPGSVSERRLAGPSRRARGDAST
jgi:hypothetical protein